MSSLWTKKRQARVALATLAAVVGGIILINNCSALERAMGAWLLFVLAAAIALNSDTGESPKVLAKLAVLPAITPLLVWAYPVLFTDASLCISFVRLTNRAIWFVVAFALFIAFVSWFAIVLFAFARNQILELATRGTEKPTADRIRNIAKTVRAIVAVVAAVGLLYLALTGRPQ
jgi:hypothetical protein